MYEGDAGTWRELFHDFRAAEDVAWHDTGLRPPGIYYPVRKPVAKAALERVEEWAGIQ